MTGLWRRHALSRAHHRERVDNAFSERPVRVLEDHLSTQPGLLDDRFTAADLNVAAVRDWNRAGQADLSGYPGIANWLNRCPCRPAFEGLAIPLARPGRHLDAIARCPRTIR